MLNFGFSIPRAGSDKSTAWEDAGIRSSSAARPSTWSRPSGRSRRSQRRWDQRPVDLTWRRQDRIGKGELSGLSSHEHNRRTSASHGPISSSPSGGYRMQAMPYQWDQWAKAGPAVASMTSTTSCMTRHSSWWRLAGCWATERRHHRVDGVVPSYGYRPRRRAQDVIAELRFLDTPTRNYQALILVGPWTTQAPRMPQPPTLTAICSMSRFFREATAPI